MVESFLLRAKRGTEDWTAKKTPALRKLETGALYFSGGFLLSGLRIWGQMQPVAIGLAMASSGWRSWVAAIGSAAGYGLFFGREGRLGMLWALGAAVLTLALHVTENANHPLGLAAASMCLVAGTGLAMQTWGGTEPGIFALRLVLAGVSAALARQILSQHDRLSRWCGGGILMMALSGFQPWLCRVAFGAAAAALPFPAAAMVGLGTDLGAAGSVSLGAVACLAFFLQRIFPRDSWRRMAAPGISCGILMMLMQVWDPALLAAVALGGAAGAWIPCRYTVVPRRSRVGAAQVRLEQTARVLNRFQRQLLDYAPPDLPAVTEQLRSACPQQTRVGEQVKRIKASRAKQEEYRMALVQQYGYLAHALHDLSDQLPQREQRPRGRFRVKVSARSRSRELADGDRVCAFPGIGCRYYVVLCDGMGTGQAASQESRQTSDLIRQMLTAGLTPETVLGSINSQLALTDRGGAVTVELVELRLDSGKAMLYRWGAGQSWLLRHRRCVELGASGPPPGLGVMAGRESVARAALGRGETLVVVSDGIRCEKANQWASFAENMEPGALAKQILEDGGNPGDDATAIVIRLESK